MMTDETSTEVSQGRKGRKVPTGVYRRHQTWWISYYVTGPDGRRVQHREPTEATSPREAANLRATRMTEHARGERTVESRKLTLADVMAAIVTDYEVNGRRSLATARGHEKAITGALGKVLATEITTERVQRIQRDWQRARASNATINRRCNLLRRGL